MQLWTGEIIATLKDGAGNPLQGQTVSFGFRLLTDTTFTPAGVGVTDPSGVATSTTLSLMAPDQYQFRASFNGTSILLPSSSVIVYDTVAQASATTISGSISPMLPSLTTPVTISGVLSSQGFGLPGEQVGISLDGKILAMVATLGDGSYSYTLGKVGAGFHVVTSSFAGSSAYLPSMHQTSFTIPGRGGGLILVTGLVAAGLLMGIALISRQKSRKR